MNLSDRIDASKIFIWGQVGEKLGALDDTRLFSVAQNNPNLLLSTLTNKEIAPLIKKLAENDYNFESIRIEIEKLNELDNIFREISSFMNETEDMLSIGSFLTGEVESNPILMNILKDEYKGDKDE